MRANRLKWGLKIFALIVVAVAVLGLAVMSLWNWLAPDLFGWHPISFVQAVGLLILCRLLVGGFRGRAGGHLHWRARLAERLEKMTPEEREKFRAGLHARCGWHSGPEAESTSHGAET
jgi:Ca2+/H+ antiporter, TMEM165/GDT1 family